MSLLCSDAALDTAHEDFLDFVIRDKEDFHPFEALYIHVPFCKARCSYCSFYTRAVRFDDAAIDRYVEELIVALRRLSKAGLLAHIKTIYFGGGTPSFLGSRYLTSILYALSVSMSFDTLEEISLECNPESVSRSFVKDLWALGVNRLSFGVQSFQDEKLKLLGRSHSAEEARQALDWAFERFSNVSLDLMAGLPCQTLENFEDDIKAALGFPLTHVSIYPLSLDEGTRLKRAYDEGLYPSQDEDLQVDMLEYAHAYLTAEGFEHYEIANFAHKRHRSKHNTVYWQGVSYLGLGSGAISMRQNSQVRERFNYQGELEERLGAHERLIEDMLLSLRLKEGLSFERIKLAYSQMGEHLGNALERCLQDFLERGLVVNDEQLKAFVPTQRGWLQANYMFGNILGLEDFL